MKRLTELTCEPRRTEHLDELLDSSGQHDLVVVANRLPINLVGDTWQTSPGGLVRAMLGVLRSRDGAWIGWSGAIMDADNQDVDNQKADALVTDTPDAGTVVASPRDSGMQFLATADAEPEPDAPEGNAPDIDMISVPLDANDFTHYYERVSNGALWPLFHDAIRESRFDAESWAVYQDVNRRFAEATAAAVAPYGTVWIHDYHLTLVPAMLRSLRPDVVIGYFLHIPFPPQELFMRMPWREEILHGLLGADVVGFQRQVGAENFVAAARRLVHADVDAPAATDADMDSDAATNSTTNVGTVHHVRTIDGRHVHVGTFPISIDVAEVEEIAASPHTRRRAAEIRTQLGNPDTVFLGVDRLDYTKGIDLRLHAFRTLLDEQPVDAGPTSHEPPPTVLVQIAVPGREGLDSYVDERHAIEQLVGDINGSHASIGYPAVHYLRRSMDLDELVALYMAADVMLVTPRRDGMNLVAKEFVASRLDDTGVLILSEFAGAADELTESILVNPHDPDAIVAAMRSAITMPPELIAHRMHELRASVLGNTVGDWAGSFLGVLADVAAGDLVDSAELRRLLEVDRV